MTLYGKSVDAIECKHGFIWRFNTARYTVACWAEEEDMSPRDSFEFDDDVAFASTGDPSHWFCVFVGVFKGEDDDNSELIGYDCLGGCSYNSFREFVGNRSGWRAGIKLLTRGYFPDMVRQALGEARAHEIRNQFGAA